MHVCGSATTGALAGGEINVGRADGTPITRRSPRRLRFRPQLPGSGRLIRRTGYCLSSSGSLAMLAATAAPRCRASSVLSPLAGPAPPRNRRTRATASVILDDEAGVRFLDGPRRWEAAAPHWRLGLGYFPEFGSSCDLGAAFCCAALVLPDDTWADTGSAPLNITAARTANRKRVLIVLVQSLCAFKGSNTVPALSVQSSGNAATGSGAGSLPQFSSASRVTAGAAGVLDLHPTVGAPGAIRGSQPLRHDALAARAHKPAGRRLRRPR